MCGKVKHKSREAACIARAKIKNAGLDVYHCRECNAWHLANSRNPLKVQKRIDQLLRR